MSRVPFDPPCRQHPLAVYCAALLAISAPAAHATAFVTNCNDSGTGSLRAAAIAAMSGDMVDASGLAGVCSTITLTTGAIPVGQTSLKFVGPGKNKLTVTVGMTGTTRLFTHSGNGTLEIDEMSLSKGYVSSGGGVATGGCIDSRGNVVLKNTNVTLCGTHTTTGAAIGGGVYAQGSFYALNSVISGNTANGGSSGGAGAGGIFALGGVTVKYSTISNNTTTNATNLRGAGGGIYSHGSASFIRNTTISGNHAGQYDGGLLAITTGTVTLINTTISNNRALHGVTGGGYIAANTLYLYNTTIADNDAYSGSTAFAAGLVVRGTGASPTMDMESTLIADNTYGMTPLDNDLFSSGFTIVGQKNLIRASSVSLPADTIVGVCPRLGPLRSNGGATQTHALLSRSPAIDAGNNVLGLAHDGRGPPYPRESGPPGTMHPVADIGAYELDQLDVVFTANFEGCP